MGRRPKEAFLQRRHIDGQQAHEKMLNITNYQRNANQNSNEVPPHTAQNQFSHSVVSDSLWILGLQHTRLSWPSTTSEACSNSYPLSHWCHPTISSSIVPFSCLQPFPALGSFVMSQFFASGGQSSGASASPLILPNKSYIITIIILDILATSS